MPVTPGLTRPTAIMIEVPGFGAEIFPPLGDSFGCVILPPTGGLLQWNKWPVVCTPSLPHQRQKP